MAKADHQLPLDLTCRPAMGREDFLVAPCNEDALSWVDHWPDWPGPALILQGPPACGKTHMADVWMTRAKASQVPAHKLKSNSADQLFQGKTPLLIDHIDPWLGSRDAETTLFHLYNMIREAGGSCLITMRMTPTQVDFAIPDLASRLGAAPMARIKAPDETLLSAILVKLFQDRQLQIDQNVVNYILPRVERSFSAIRDLVNRADSLALSKRRAISIPLMREVLAQEHEDDIKDDL